MQKATEKTYASEFCSLIPETFLGRPHKARAVLVPAAHMLLLAEAPAVGEVAGKQAVAVPRGKSPPKTQVEVAGGYKTGSV